MNLFMFLAASLMPSGRQFLLIFFIAAFVLIVFWRNRGRRDPMKSSMFARKGEASPANAAETPDTREMRQLLGQLESFAADLNARLDEKTNRLEHLMAEADKRITALRTLIEAARAAGVSMESILEGVSSAKNEVAEPHPEPPAIESSVDGDYEADPRTNAIYQLADEGLTAMQIAQRLNQHMGEVELILNLRSASRDA